MPLASALAPGLVASSMGQSLPLRYPLVIKAVRQNYAKSHQSRRCHGARSVAVSYKPPMLVTRVRLPACAFFFHCACKPVPPSFVTIALQQTGPQMLCRLAAGHCTPRLVPSSMGQCLPFRCPLVIRDVCPSPLASQHPGRCHGARSVAVSHKPSTVGNVHTRSRTWVVAATARRPNH